MAGRILTLQRQARELGRLRAGTFEKPANAKGRPTRSRTWILTSHQRAYLDAAAEQWGGDVQRWQPQGGGAEAWRLITTSESVDAILPPGDPLSQFYEMWSRGGCQRRCDGEVEQLTNAACLCRAQFGDEFHAQPPEAACRPHTRLNVILPDVPDLGVWRMETKGFYAANEIAASIDLIRNATGGNVMVPVRLRIEPRKRVAQGKTKQYPVIVVEIRGATAGQILSGSAPVAALTAPEVRPALEAAAPATTTAVEPVRDWLREIAAATNQVQLDRLKDEMRAKGVTDRDVVAAWMARSAQVTPANGTAAASGPEPDPDEVWQRIVAAAPDGWGTSGLQDRIAQFLDGKTADDANGFELAAFLDAMKSGQVPA